MYGFGDHDDQQGQDKFGGGNNGGDDRGEGGRKDGPNSKNFGTGLSYNQNQSSLDVGLAVAMFGNQLGPQIAGIKGITKDAASDLAGRLNVGQLEMSGLSFGALGSLLNEVGKKSASQVFNQIVQGADAVYNSRGFITGAETDERGLVAGYRSDEVSSYQAGREEGTFTSGSNNDQPKDTSVTSSSSAIAISDYEERRSGSADSSGSGRRSLLRKVY
jgi:hypothetical protein